MQSVEPKKLGGLFGRYSVWPEDYLPEPKGSQKEGVLSDLLKDTDYEIESLESYRKDYSRFHESYSPLEKAEMGEPKRRCDVPYWTRKLWKTQKRIVIFGQKSLNEGKASVPLYSPLFEIDSWKRAFKTGDEFNFHSRDLYKWNSFMLNWMAVRAIFSHYSNMISALKQVYYTDIGKFSDEEKNKKFLEEEMEIVKPKFVIFLGKEYKDYGSFLDEYIEKDNINWIYFPTGRGAPSGTQPEYMKECGEKLKIFLKN